MKKRSGVSPVVASVILIAITLIAAVAMAGFVFGLFGSFTNTPRVSAQSQLSSQGGLSGQLVLYNQGTSSAVISNVSLTYEGQTCSVSYYSSGVIPSSGQTTIIVQAGQFVPGSSTYKCGQEGTPSVASPGMAYTGTVVLDGGSQVFFTGAFQ